MKPSNTSGISLDGKYFLQFAFAVTLGNVSIRFHIGTSYIDMYIKRYEDEFYWGLQIADNHTVSRFLQIWKF